MPFHKFENKLLTFSFTELKTLTIGFVTLLVNQLEADFHKDLMLFQRFEKNPPILSFIFSKSVTIGCITLLLNHPDATFHIACTIIHSPSKTCLTLL